MGTIVDRRPSERTDLGYPWRVIARGLLNQAGAAWIGAHPGFTDVITDTGAGNQTVHLANAGAATMYGRAVVATSHHVGRCGAMAGGTLQDLPVLCATDAGAPADAVVFVEVLDTNF